MMLRDDSWFTSHTLRGFTLAALCIREEDAARIKRICLSRSVEVDWIAMEMVSGGTEAYELGRLTALEIEFRNVHSRAARKSGLYAKLSLKANIIFKAHFDKVNDPQKIS
jgi:hypothetical protein